MGLFEGPVEGCTEGDTDGRTLGLFEGFDVGDKVYIMCIDE